jgi:VanZ family protein
VSFRRWITSSLTFLPATLWYAGITFLSHQPKLPGPGDQGVYDFMWFKSGHVFAYSLLLVFLFIGTLQVVRVWKLKVARNKLVLFSLSMLIVLAAIDELHQSFIPGRTPRLSDVFIDTLGSGAVLFVLERYNAFLPLFSRKMKK